MNTMKKLLIIFAFLFAFFLFSNSLIYAQTTPSPSPGATTGIGIIPGVDCGNSTAPENSPARLCCKSQLSLGSHEGLSDWLSQLLNVAKSVPVIGDKMIQPLTNFNDFALQLQRNAAPLACPLGYPSTTDPNDTNCTCLTTINPSPIAQLKTICQKYHFDNAGEEGACESCANASGVWTGLGCIYGDTGKFIRETVFSLAISLAGVFALLCIIFSAFSLQISQGNPEKIKKAQELLTSCIMGLMLIIFSVFILRLIGVSILKIPGLGN